MAGAEYANLRRYFPQELPEAKFASVMDYLKAELGLLVFEKRNLIVPIPTPGGVIRAFGPEGIEKSEKSLKALNQFLEGVPVGDKFGSDHAHGRQPKRGEVHARLKAEDTELAKSFWALYYTNNQFVGNRLGGLGLK